MLGNLERIEVRCVSDSEVVKYKNKVCLLLRRYYSGRRVLQEQGMHQSDSIRKLCQESIVVMDRLESVKRGLSGR